MSLFDTDLASLQSLANDGLTLPSMSSGSDAATASTPAPSTVTPVSSSSTSLPSTSGIGSALSSVASNLNPVNWIFSSRFVAIVLGLICIAGAIFLFKGPAIISTTAKGAAIA